MDAIKFWLDVAPQIISIICLAVYSWRKMNAMSEHLYQQDSHLRRQDVHLVSHGRNLRAITGQLNKLTEGDKDEC